MTKIKLAVFDLDGTLLNSLPDIAASLNGALRGSGLPEHGTDAVLAFIGDGVEELILRALPAGRRNDRALYEQVLKDFQRNYRENGTRLTRPYDGIPALLRELDERGIAVAVASNKYQAATEPIVGHYFGGIRFAAVEGRRDGRPAKPDPTIVRDILARTGIRPEETLFVGDSDVDMRTARNAGAKGIGVSWGYRSRGVLTDAGAESVIDRPDQLLGLLG